MAAMIVSCASASVPTAKPAPQPKSTKVRVELPGFTLTLPHSSWRVEPNASADGGALVSVAALHGPHGAQITILVGKAEKSLKFMAEHMWLAVNARGFEPTPLRTEVGVESSFSGFSMIGENDGEAFGARVVFVRIHGLEGFVYSLNGVWPRDWHDAILGEFESILRSIKANPKK